MATSIFRKFGEDRVKLLQTYRVENTNLAYVAKFKGLDSKVSGWIWLVIKLDRDIMASNIFSKFSEDRMKTV